MVQTTCFFHADAESPQDVLRSAVFGEVLQSQGDFDPQTRPHIGRRARHPSQLLFPDERVSELPVGILQLTANRNKPKLVWDPQKTFSHTVCPLLNASQREKKGNR